RGDSVESRSNATRQPEGDERLLVQHCFTPGSQYTARVSRTSVETCPVASTAERSSAETLAVESIAVHSSAEASAVAGAAALASAEASSGASMAEPTTDSSTISSHR